jgi:hypothetical protein
VDRSVLERVIAPGLDVQMKGSKSGRHERKIDHTKQNEEPRQQEHHATDGRRWAVSEYQWGNNQELDDKRQNRSPKKPSREPPFAPPEQPSPLQECGIVGLEAPHGRPPYATVPSTIPWR